MVLDVTFQLVVGDLSAPVRYAELANALGVELNSRAPLADVREAVLALRRGKGMVLDAADHDTWSAGSFFTNPVVTVADLDRIRGRSAVSVPNYPAPGGVKLPATSVLRGSLRGVPRLPDVPEPWISYERRGEDILERLHLWTDRDRRRVERYYEICLPVRRRWE